MKYYNRTNTCDECGNKLECGNILREYRKGNWTGRWICRNCYDDKKTYGKYRHVHILKKYDANIKNENNKGTLGCLREQVKKDGFDNIRDWLNWKIKQENIEQSKSKVRNIEQIEKFENKEFNIDDRYNFYSFWSNVDIKDNIKECWNWTKFISPGGYGYFKYGAVYGDIPQRVHRISYVLTKGIIPDNKIIMHLCNNRICCNPYHLELGDYSKNLIYAYRCNRRDCNGENNSGAILIEYQVKEIHKIHKEYPELKQRQIAKMFKIDQAEVSNILNGKRWNRIYEETYGRKY